MYEDDQYTLIFRIRTAFQLAVKTAAAYDDDRDVMTISFQGCS